jgi:hypothetical protein
VAGPVSHRHRPWGGLGRPSGNARSNVRAIGPGNQRERGFPVVGTSQGRANLPPFLGPRSVRRRSRRRIFSRFAVALRDGTGLLGESCSYARRPWPRSCCRAASSKRASTRASSHSAKRGEGTHMSKAMLGLVFAAVVYTAAAGLPRVTAPRPEATNEPAKSGCCSWHGGVCGCSDGRAQCCDGTLSPSCGC